ncbi:MAG: DegT/DnrJ/EryC1/StrS family aminotransferase, partial [Nitrososphaerales archaeon]
FVDIKRSDYTMDPDDLERKLIGRRRARVVIPVHLYGHTADMARIGEIAASHSLRIVEDACQSLGSEYDGKQTGSIGDIGCFSFYASKVITCGEGGAAVTRSRELAERMRMIRNRGRGRRRISGLNTRMTEISAAIAKIQMRKLGRMLRIRRRNSKTLTRLLHDLETGSGLVLPAEPAGSRFNWYLYTVAFKDGRQRDRLLKKLNSSGIGAAVYYGTPVHRTPFYASNLSLPNTEWAAAHLLSLPVHPLLSTRDMEHVAGSLRRAISG